ncbi:MAG: MDR family MFS transporter [Actinomycetota bacterium]
MTRRQIMLVFAGTMLAMLLAALDQTIVATALPSIVTDLHGLQHYSWVATAYLVTSTITVPIYGKLSDLYGRRLLFLVAIGIFLVGSMLCGLSQSMTQLIAFRGLQGFGAGGIFPLAQATIGDLFSARERGRYAGYTGAVFASASIIGPLAGGYLTDNISWRWIFYVNLPLGALALFVVAAKMHIPFKRREHRIDYLGTAVLTAAVTSLLLVAVWGGITYPWTSGVILGLAVVGVLLAGAFVLVERRASEPVVPLALFRDSIFNVTTATAFLFGVSMFGAIFFIPLFMQKVIGVSATNSGIVLMPLMLAWVATSVLAGQLVSRTGRYKIFPVIGSVVVVLGFYLLTRLNIHSTSLEAVIDMIVIGLGMGMVFQVYLVAMQNSIEPSQMGIATATTQFFRSMGATFGVAVFGTVLFNRLQTEIGSLVHGVDFQTLINAPVGRIPPALAHKLPIGLSVSLHTVFIGCLVVGVIAAAISFLLKEVPLRTTSNVAAALSSELGQGDAEGDQAVAETAVRR